MGKLLTRAKALGIFARGRSVDGELSAWEFKGNEVSQNRR